MRTIRTANEETLEVYPGDSKSKEVYIVVSRFRNANGVTLNQEQLRYLIEGLQKIEAQYEY